MDKEFDDQIKSCDKTFFKNLKPGGYQAIDPIFILGLPRSGSTLIEQILASHSLIDGTLELPNILSLAHTLRGDDVYGKEGRYPKIIEELSADQRESFGKAYIDETSIHRKSAPLFTDKMPNNFRHIALIYSILPIPYLSRLNSHFIGYFSLLVMVICFYRC